MLFFLLFFFLEKYKGSYMSAHVVLNLLKELRKRDKMRGLPSVMYHMSYELVHAVVLSNDSLYVFVLVYIS